MKKITFFIFSILLSTLSYAQLVTPGTGVYYNLSELSDLDPSILSFDGTKYTLSDDLTIAGDDGLIINTTDTLFVDADKRITVEGQFIIDIPDNESKFVLRATDTLNPFDGVRYQDLSAGLFNNVEITYSGGLKVITSDFVIKNSYLAYNVSGAATGSTISLSNGSPLIQNNVFYKNDLPAVGSGANQEVSAHIINNLIEKNTQSNQNRPQLNMGPTGSDTLKIKGNTIIGDPAVTKAGGISVSNFLGYNIITEIEDNVIQNNRYGITVAGGNAYAMIKGNIIENNNTQNNPAIGGSGISVNSSSDTQTIIARENEIRGNLWGITVINQASIDLGTSADLGYNRFSNNGNNGVTYALYNNTNIDLNAMGNCWIESNESATATEIEDVIFHENDDTSLGLVDFSEWTCVTLGTETPKISQINIYPNPAKNYIQLNNKNGFETLKFYNINGQLMKEVKLSENKNTIDFSLPQGLYFLKFSSDQHEITEKLIVR
ncbi:T9SS type A sorting domain-containing protein [Psychroflexus halocasei]|uniref:Por secretion system C-terminal sorting domain-containing protein n=1 Tax=Psychroflexus halocasei TaxID=908615 RepID=A0A1H3Y920_9FLAO|nr:T9SS type A sorting domain-containing protein [Psychroflexus halocasei]SEA07501.1 Por secretion system C-terminal sorting domain-containing protein [Psychroflexus halocasei]